MFGQTIIVVVVVVIIVVVIVYYMNLFLLLITILSSHQTPDGNMTKIKVNSYISLLFLLTLLLIIYSSFLEFLIENCSDWRQNVNKKKSIAQLTPIKLSNSPSHSPSNASGSSVSTIW